MQFLALALAVRSVVRAPQSWVFGFSFRLCCRHSPDNKPEYTELIWRNAGKGKKKFVSVFVFHSLLDSRSLHAEGTKICNMNLEHKCRRILAFSDIFFKDYLQLRIFEWTTFVILVKKPGVTFIPGGLGPHRLYLILNGKRRGRSFQW